MAPDDLELSNKRWELLLAFSEEEFRRVQAACRGGPVSQIVDTFRDESSSVQQQQELLGEFLPQCRGMGNANMYVYECGHVALRFFVKRDKRAVMVLNIDRPEDVNSADPPKTH